LQPIWSRCQPWNWVLDANLTIVSMPHANSTIKSYLVIVWKQPMITDD
jgi:hypothetical protein